MYIDVLSVIQTKYKDNKFTQIVIIILIDKFTTELWLNLIIYINADNAAKQKLQLLKKYRYLPIILINIYIIHSY